MEEYLLQENKALREEIKNLYQIIGGIRFFVEDKNQGYERRMKKIKEMLDKGVGKI